ncbi:unnamed protein product [Diamesa hyperborea]
MRKVVKKQSIVENISDDDDDDDDDDNVAAMEELENDENQAENDENQAENDENQAENDENQAENDENVPANQVTPVEESLNSNTSIPINNSCDSFLGDSNAENVEPIGHKSPSKARKHMSAMRSPLRSPLKSLRSPLKSLPIPSQTEFGAVSSPLVVFNLTAQQLMYPKRIGPISTVTSKDTEALKPTKSLDLVDDSVNNEQDDFSKMLAMGNDSVDSDQEEPCTSKQSEAREHLNFDEKLREVQNEFGFDELLEESRSGNKTTSGNNDDVDDEIKMHLQNLKKYLPSRQNKDRTKEIFATSPLKKNKNLFKSPMIDNLTDIRKAFHASTPVNAVKKQQLMRNIFMNTSKIELPVDSVEKDDSIEQIELDEASLIQEREASIDQQDKSVVEVSDPENSITVNEEAVDEEFIGSNLFNDQSELFNNNTKSYHRKRRFEFLNAPDDQADDEDDQEDEPMLKRQTKSKKKKPDIEKSREFMDFVLNKSKEFAEVDEYQLIVEKVKKP